MSIRKGPPIDSQESRPVFSAAAIAAGHGQLGHIMRENTVDVIRLRDGQSILRLSYGDNVRDAGIELLSG